ncbi:hypothetical protein [Thalassobacillus sp. C254]|uniref:hypothetical protein n=1 Tax=Thalassobacillus sp. C254 TaxID=1225341 RepID=UPI0006D0F06E|nr:hypothetical protein [Thalassobacillus sp. C254]
MKKKVCMMLVLTMVMSLFIASFAAASPPSHSQVNKDLAQLRQATVQYQDIEKAIDDGYNDPHNCIPGMGIHLINPTY